MTRGALADIRRRGASRQPRGEGATRKEVPLATVFRVVAAGWWLGWFWKAPFYAGYLLDETFAWRLDYPDFPAVLQHPAVSAAAWLAPAAALPALVWPRPPAVLLRAAAAILAASALVLCIHLETFTDATFVTSFWVAAWLLWLAFQDDSTRTRLHARVLAQCLVAALFLGPAIGKLTTEYTGGEAFYRIYFLGKDSWPYPWLRAHVAPETLRELATWFSRAAIAGELLLSVSPLLPPRFAAIFGITFLVGMVVVSTWYLVSVLASLAALLVGALLLSRASDTLRA